MTNFARHRSVYSITQSGRVWPVYESQYNKLWAFSRLLNSRLTRTREWIKQLPPIGDDGLPPQNDIVNGGFISDLAFSFDGRYLIAGSTCSEAYLLDPNTTKPEVVFSQASSDAITRVCFAGDTKFVVGSADGSLILWDVRNTKEAACMLVGHTKVIRSINYDREGDLLVTSSNDDHIRYWNIAMCQAAAQNGASNEEDLVNPLPCGVLLNCPNLSLACMSSTNKKFAFITTNGSLYVVDNLNLKLLKSDMQRFRFDNSILLQLSWFTPNSSLNSRNRLRVIERNDVIPNAPAEVTKVNYMDFHDSFPVLVVRMTTSRKTMFALEKKEWTCAYDFGEKADTAALYYSHKSMSVFGSDVVQERLIYSYEEERYNPLREKRLSFSSCGRLIASPSKKCVQLLSFSKELNTPFEAKAREQKFSTFDSLWPSSTTDFNVFSVIEMPENATVCTKFSPRDYLLVVGDTSNHVHFFQPVL